MSARSPQAADRVAHYQDLFEANPSVTEPGWLAAIRREAIGHFAEQGIPDSSLEDWRYTNLARIAKSSYEPARDDGRSAAEPLEALGVADLGGPQLVFVDGRCVRAPDPAASPVRVARLADLGATMAEAPDGALERLGRLAEAKSDALRALNLAFASEVAIVELPSSVVHPDPIHLVFVSTGDAERPRMSHPRVLVLAAPDSAATLVQEHVSLGSGDSLTNAVVEVAVGRNAGVELVLVQREHGDAKHVSALCVEQERDSRFTAHTFTLDGALTRNQVTSTLLAPGAECTLRGLTLGSADQHIDNHTCIDHAMPHCSSRELYKAVHAGSSRGVFRGRVIVRPDAQKTDAIQQNRNLLLSRRAEVDAMPQLEIYADDVKCSHGSTIGQLDPDAMFFLRARGIGEDEARTILTQGFANEITEGIGVAAVGDWIDGIVRTQMLESPEGEGAR